MTKYEMAVAIAQAFKLPSNHLVPVSPLVRLASRGHADVFRNASLVSLAG